MYDDYEICYLNGEKKNDLKSNIKNLVNMIDDYYKEFIVDSINEVINDKRDIIFEFLVNLIIMI